MDGARDYYAKQNKSVRERQIPYDFTHMWNLRNKTNEQGGKEKRETEKERGKPNQETDYREHTDGYQRGGGWRDGLNR